MTRRLTETLLLVALPIAATAVAFSTNAGSIGHLAAGATLGILISWAAIRLPTIRRIDSQAIRIAASGSLALSLVTLSGLLVLLTSSSFTERGTVLILAAISVGLVVLGTERANGRELFADTRRQVTDSSLQGSALLVLALGAIVFAFFLVRNANLRESTRHKTFAAFLVPGQSSLSVGLSNPTSESALFVIAAYSGRHGGVDRVNVLPHENRLVPAPIQSRFLSNSNPEETSYTSPLRIHVSILVNGQRRGPRLRLFYSP